MLPLVVRRIRRVCAASLLLGVVTMAEPCLAFQYRRPSSSNSANNAASNAAKSNVDSAKKNLDAAVKRLNDIRPKHQQAEAEFKKEQREHQQAVETAKREFEQAPELVRARETHAAAKKAFEEERQRVVAKMKSQPAYKAALKAELEAKERHDGPAAKELSDESRKALAKEEAAAVAAVRRLEEEAVNQDSAAKQAHEREHDAAEELLKHTKKRDATINGDSRVSSSKIAFEKARDTEKLAHREFQAAESAAAQAQRMYQSATATYTAQLAQAAQQRAMTSSRSTRGRRTQRPHR